MKRFLPILPLLFCISVFQLSAKVIYVNRDASGIINGTSWTNAFISLHIALNAAVSGDQIWVAKGVYYASTPFMLKGGVGVYGGFTGTET